jgi:hypothetical protein
MTSDAVFPSWKRDGADTSFAELCPGMIRFWCEGCTYEVDVDGKRILM